MNEFIIPLKQNISEIAKVLEISYIELSDICLQEQHDISGISEKLAKLYGTSTEFWVNLQTSYEHSLKGKTP